MVRQLASQPAAASGTFSRQVLPALNAGDATRGLSALS